MNDASSAPIGASARNDRARAFAWLAVAYAAALAAGVAAAWMLPGRNPILVAAVADVVATVVVFGFSLALGNSSVYDPYWSVAPIPIVAYWALVPGASAASALRQALVLLLVTAWGVRLTVNCLVRWHGLGEEDFRYREIRAKTGRLYWPASFFSIHVMPTAWVFLGLLPTYPALALPGRPAGPLDLVAASVTALAIVIEAVSDLQLRRFMSTRRDPEAVLDVGLWSVSRHPNYFGEVLFWWGLWLFGMAANPSWAWTAVGPISITLLFALVSVPWMDRRMLARHPSWAGHMRSTSAIVPWPRRRG
jgi:steroid 5-alpha reductase family enzyme